MSIASSSARYPVCPPAGRRRRKGRAFAPAFVRTAGVLALLLGAGAARAGDGPGITPFGLGGMDTPNWVLDPSDPNPYRSTIGSGRNSPNGYSLTIKAGATAFPTGNNPAISVNDGWTIDIYGTVQNQANGGNGLWNAGPNTVETHSDTVITVYEGGQILATGGATNGEAVNFIGINNVVVNYGLVQSKNGAAIWFQDTIPSSANSNTVENYGIVRTLKGKNSSAIGNSGNNGVVFNNHEGALVDGGLSFAGGDDLLTFYAGSSVTGAINGGGGTNALVLHGKAGSDDSLAGALRNFTTLTKKGEGLWTITGSLAGFTVVGIEEGTLRLTGNNADYNGSVAINSTGAHPNAVLEAKARSLPTTSSNVGNIRNDGILRFVDSRADDDGGVGDYAGQIVGSGLVEMTGDGVVTLLNANNTYAGGTYVQNGTLNVIADATLGDVNGKIVLGHAASGQSPTTGTLQFGAAFDLASTRAIELAGAGGVVDTNGFNATIARGITGASGSAFTKAGTGTLVLTGDNTYDGGTYIAGGTLQVGDGGTSGGIPYNGIIDIAGAAAALAINRSDDVAISTRVTGAGKFIQRGAGTTTLAAANAYAGGTDIENGTLAVSDNLNLGSGGPLAFGTATTRGTLRMDGDVNLDGRAISLKAGGGTIDTQGFQGVSNGVVTGVGGLTKTGAGLLTLTGDNDYAGGTTIAQGALQLGDGGTSGGIVGNVLNNGSLIFNRSDDVNSLALAGVISGTGDLIQRGGGTTTLSGGNSYSGGTRIENGTLAVNADAALGAATGGLTFGTETSGGTLKLTGDIDDLARQRNVTIQRGGGTINTDGHDATVAANIQGPGHFTKTGDGTLTLAADNAFTGGATVAGGELELGDNRIGGVGSVIGDVEVQGTGTVVYNRADNNTDPAGTVWGSGNVVQRGDGVTTVANANTYTGGTTLQGGTLAISRDANLGDGGAVIFDGGALRLNDDLTDFDSTRRVTLQSDGTIDTFGHAGAIGAIIDGGGSLTKAGAGELVLTGENTYTGDTTVAAGTLRLGDGASAAGNIVGDVVVDSGAAFQFDRIGSKTYGGEISGAGAVVQKGVGTTVLTGENTYAGGTTVEAGGTMQIGDGGSGGSIANDVANDGTLAFNRSDTTFAGKITGSGEVHQMGPGTTILTADSDYTGGTRISGGALQLGACGPNGWIVGDVALSNGGTLIFSNSADKTENDAFAGLVSGDGSVVKSCANQLELTADNTFTGGTELRQGAILMTNAASLGSMTAADSLAGHVWYSATVGDPDTDRIFEVSGTVNQIQNHFHVSAGVNNVFQTNGDLTIAGVENNSSQQYFGGAFYVAGGAALDLNIGQAGKGGFDLTLENNKYDAIGNDFHLDSYSTLNLNVRGADGDSKGNAVFVNSGIGGQGMVFVNGSSDAAGRGIVQIASDSEAEQTVVTGTALRLVQGTRFANSIYGQDTASVLQGNGTIDVSGSSAGRITISGTISPDGATFDSGDDIVGRAERFDTLTLTGGTTELNAFTFAYDVAGPTSPGVANDLVMFGSQNVEITDGTVDFITLGSAGITTGRYLVFDSAAATYTDRYGTALTDATLNGVLKGTVNGQPIDSGTPRLGYRFEFGDGNGQSKNQVWFDVDRNTLQVVWQGGAHDWQDGNWTSVQYNGTVYANDVNDGDLVIFNNAPSARQTATLVSDVLVSGLQVNTISCNSAIADIVIAGNGNITARRTDPEYIVGKYANGTDPQRFDTTGKLEMRGIGGGANPTTLTISNIGVNTFEEGIDLYGGRIALNGPDNRLGVYGSVAGHAHAGLVTFVGDGIAGSQRILEIAGQNQLLQNKFVVSDGLDGNSLVATGVNATIQNAAGVTGDAVTLGSSSALTVGGTGNVIVQSGMTGEGGSRLVKTGVGTLQLEADADADHTVIDDGVFRVVDGVTFGGDIVPPTRTVSSSFTANFAGAVAGAGTIMANQLAIYGHLSPDNLNAADATAGSRYGTLTFVAADGGRAIAMDGFSMRFDVTTPTQLSGGLPANDQDLLVLNGTTVTLAGANTVDFRSAPGGAFQKGEYLVVKSSDGYDQTNATINGVLRPMIDGYDLSASSPRGTLAFELRDSDTGMTGGNDRDIWIVNALNSLSMNWTGVTANPGDPQSGTWERGVDRMLSAQGSAGARESQFMNGDKVFIHNPGADPITVTLTRALQGDAVDVTVSGLVVGKDSGSAMGGDDAAGTVHDGNVTIDGLGGITANAGSAFGNYIDPDPAHVQLKPTGSLQKFGDGGLIVRNTGGNSFLGGTELYGGSIAIGHHQALGAVDGTGANLDGYVFFAGTDNADRAVTVFPTDGTAPITDIKNHFRAVAAAGTNTFAITNPLTISGVANNALPPVGPGPDHSQGGAFYVGGDSNLTIRADGDLTLSGNSFNTGSGPVANDILLALDSTLNVDVADAKGVFIGSGILGDGGEYVQKGTIVLNGTGTVKNGFLQIAAESYVAYTGVQSGRLRLVDNKFLANSMAFTLSDGASFEGNGYLYADDGSLFQGIVSPDAAKFASGTDAVADTEKIGVLRIQGGNTTFDGFTFQYDVVGPNTTKNPNETKNDLIQLASQPAFITGGTINFRTADADTPLGLGKYLVIDSNATKFWNDNGIALLDNAALNGILKGKINGEAFEAFGPRISHDFYFDANNTNPDSQIWLDVARNTLQVDFTAGQGPWNTTQRHWRSRQYTGGAGNEVAALYFQHGDSVYFTNDNASTPFVVTLAEENVTVSGMTVGKNADGGSLGTGDFTFSGDYGITAKRYDADLIVGKYANAAAGQSQRFDTTGKLEKYGTGTLTLANTGQNVFEEGVDVYGGTVALAGADRLGVYGALSGHVNAGLVTFKHVGPGDDADGKYIDVMVEQKLVNRFVVEGDIKAAYLRAYAGTTISGVVGDAQSGALRVGNASVFTMAAMDADIVMAGNKTSVATDNDIYLDNATIAFQSGDGVDAHHIFIDSGIAGTGTVQKNGPGILQIAADSTFAGTTEVLDGIFRVVGDRSQSAGAVVYGDAASAVFNGGVAGNGRSTIAGGGIIAGNTFVIGDNTPGNTGMAYISPDSATLSNGATDTPDAQQYGTLTLQGNGAGSTLAIRSIVHPDYPNANDRTGFHFDYDVFASNTLSDGSLDPDAAANTRNDLLRITGMDSVRLEGGVVDFRTGTDGLRSGHYLIVDSNVAMADGGGNAFVTAPEAGRTVLDGINDYGANGGVLWGRINGQDIRVGSPRRHMEFKLRDGDRQIWLDVANNTLQVVWQGGADNVWTLNNSWKSLQYNDIGGGPIHDNEFYNGDYVIFDDTVDGDGYTVTLNENVVVGGLDAATGQTLVLDGTGGIHAVTQNSADYGRYVEGVYADGAPLQNQRFDTTGVLEKTGAGTWTFANAGANTFDGGIVIEAGVLSYNNADQLLVGTGKAITFTGGPSTLRADATAHLKADVVVNQGVEGAFHADAGIAMLVDGTVSGPGSLEKTGAGSVQFSKSSADFNGRADVREGRFRVLKDVVFGGVANESFALMDSTGLSGAACATLEGAGTIRTNSFTASAKTVISPDHRDLDNPAAGSEIATLTIQGTGTAPKAVLDGFTMDYDTAAPNGADADPDNTANDLLRFAGMDTVTVVGGTINFRGAFATGDYLIVHADTGIGTGGRPIDGIENRDGVLTASYNGNLLGNATPRYEVGFELRDYNNVANSQLWLTNEVNSLFMRWSAGSNDWGGPHSWTSEQTTLSGGRENAFHNGDFVSFADRTGNSTANLATDVLVSGLDTDTDRTVLFTGAGGITAMKDDAAIEGRFAETDANKPLGDQGFRTTGLLRKNGIGTTTFANTGTNLFTQGIELYNGTLSYGHANQLTVGSGRYLTIKGDATLRADATAALNAKVDIEKDKTGSFHAGSGVAMLLQESVSGDGSLAKTGGGLVQLGADSTLGGGVTVAEGGLRVVVNRRLGANGIAVEDGATLLGGGGVVADTIVVNGRLSPDNHTERIGGSVVEADRFGTLTLTGDVRLDGFTLDYDLGTAFGGTGLPPASTGDLLDLYGAAELTGGHIALRGDLENGRYLIINADRAINVGDADLDGIEHADGLLTASVNGHALDNDTPRQMLEFHFENGQKQIWLESTVNTLFVDWTGGAGLWDGASWTSRQTTLDGDPDKTFRGGDRVAFLDGTQDSSATLARDVVVAGLDVDTSKNVTIDGNFKIRATKNDALMVGEFVKTDGSATGAGPAFNTTGLLRKQGTGTLTFNNAGNTFEEGILLEGGTTAFNRAAQLGDGGHGIAFGANATLRPEASLELGNTVLVGDGVTATFETADRVVLDYIGALDGDAAAKLDKTGAGTMNINADSQDYRGTLAVSGGTFGVYAKIDYATGIVVRDGATLTGHGPNAVIGSGTNGVIQSGGTLAPRGLSPFAADATPTAEYLTFHGDLRFNAGAVFDVTIAQYDGGEEKLTPVSDCVRVAGGGTVTIDSGAQLNVDYWDDAKIDTYNEEQSSKFTIIDATAGDAQDAAQTFALTAETVVPRGVALRQGWQWYDAGWREYGAGWLYQIWFEDDPDGGFDNLCDRHNRQEIGGNLDWIVDSRDGGLRDLVDRLSRPELSDPDVCDSLDWLHGDLVPNALQLKKPWRHPFGQLDRDDRPDAVVDPAVAASVIPERHRLWAEVYGRLTDAEFDGNAHGYALHRTGFALGYDWRFGDRTLAGATFNYSEPRLDQRTGKVTADDFEFGVYGRTGLGAGLEANAYFGYSRQRYDFRRRVRLPAAGPFPALSESFHHKTNGHALAASLELRRAFQVHPAIMLRPVAALDYEQAWMDGFRESGGLTALAYGDSTLMRLALRAGLQAEVEAHSRLNLRARVQYERQLNGRDYGRTDVRFVNAVTPGQPKAGIRGVEWGRDALNLGFGLDWTLNRKRSAKLYVNADVDLYKNATTYAGELGFSLAW